MSVSNQTNKISGLGNGVTTTFSYPFKIFDTSELFAYLIDTLGNVQGPLTYTTNFTATISAVTEGGTITFVVPPPTGYTWFLKRLVPYTQSASIPSEGTFPGKQFENQLDLQMMAIIQANETVTRCLQFPATYQGTLPVTIPGGLANAAIGWDPTGTFLTNLLVTAIGPVSIPLISPGFVNGSALTGLANTPVGAGFLPNANLAPLTTAGLVSGASLISLPSIPLGAGLIPKGNVGRLLGSVTAKSASTIYQAATDLLLLVTGDSGTAFYVSAVMGPTSPPTTYSISNSVPSSVSNGGVSVTLIIPSGFYYEIFFNGNLDLAVVFPIGS